MTPKFVFGKEKNDWIKRPLLSNIEKILDYRGRTPKKLGLSWSDTGFLALSALNVKNGYIDFNADANYGDQELYNRWMGDNNLHKGQVVFTTEAPMGNVAQIPNDALYILSQRTIAFEVKHHLIREDFLATLLRSPKIFNELTSLSSGGTAKGISQKSLSNLKISLPASLDEQSAIGSLFRTLDDLLASYKNNLANYQSLKATMLSKMFPKDGEAVPEIRLDGFEGEWEVVNLGTLIESYDEIISGVSGFPIATSSRKGLYLQNDYFEGGRTGIDLTLDFHRVPIGYVTYRHMSDDSIFKFNKNNFETDVLVSKEYPVFINNDNSDIDFLLYHLNNSRLFLRFSTMQKLGGTRVRLYYKNLITYKLAVPTVKEQQAIGSYFSKLDQLITSYREKITQLETLKKKLLQDMFI
ncbi:MULTISPECIES: restriction endonuclease subunit S [Streptococcus]|jgi:type I restriction enzyme S subunit|uniref:Type I restriction endonuclease subunit S n=2 Tax=Streptococcus TaxID=1301 RepID=A0A0E2Q3F6_STRTR|nr:MULTISPECIES: restriction endonuclease subunit S [Streptococcus]ETW90255.1 type I restriction endonuclease subunit S [Streptococcus thermophilus M17PTZA496]MDB8589993.1 restriction endonuclease subunit S [Streptococcus salivarius]MDB8603276.1 restriction endonuclease subunit S [Streptococcus salivarius]MDB8604954.1 restriction endonuclease subunit S [Streptococcus salivarius]MDB8606912.1 restriction endonuclease subunit S [Streptococcus salivarius]